MDSLLVQSYEQHISDYIHEGPRLEDREEDLEAKYHSLVAQGKFREAMEAARRPTDRRVVELWKECLAETEAHAYPVRIEMEVRRQPSIMAALVDWLRFSLCRLIWISIRGATPHDLIAQLRSRLHHCATDVRAQLR